MGKAKLFLGMPDIAEQLYWRHKQALIYLTWQQDIDDSTCIQILLEHCRVFHTEQKHAHVQRVGEYVFLILRGFIHYT